MLLHRCYQDVAKPFGVLCVCIVCIVWLFGCLIVWLFGCLLASLFACLFVSFVCLLFFFVCLFPCFFCLFAAVCLLFRQPCALLLQAGVHAVAASTWVAIAIGLAQKFTVAATSRFAYEEGPSGCG